MIYEVLKSGLINSCQSTFNLFDKIHKYFNFSGIKLESVMACIN